MFKRVRTSTRMSRRRNESVSVKSNGEFYAFCKKLDLDHDMKLAVSNDDVSWEHEFYDVQVKDIVGIIKKTVEDAWGFKLKV